MGPMSRPLRSLFSLLLLAAPAPAVGDDGSITGSLPEYHAQDPQAAVVTDANLLASERFWPYQVTLTSEWRPAGRVAPLAPDTSGVLIRVEPSGLARIDFGREGLYETPVARTDLVVVANRVRTGEAEKLAPNLVLAIAPRLVDASADTLRPFPFSGAANASGFLCVYADPAAPGFPALAQALAPLRGRHSVVTLLFPQGEHSDSEVRERLRALDWSVPFVYDHLAEAYTRTLLDAATASPALQLLTREGRVLWEGVWRPDRLPELDAALARVR